MVRPPRERPLDMGTGFSAALTPAGQRQLHVELVHSDGAAERKPLRPQRCVAEMPCGFTDLGLIAADARSDHSARIASSGSMVAARRAGR